MPRNSDIIFIGIFKSVRPILVKIKSTDFRISNELLETVLKEAGENKY